MLIKFHEIIAEIMIQSVNAFIWYHMKVIRGSSQGEHSWESFRDERIQVVIRECSTVWQGLVGKWRNNLKDSFRDSF